MTRKQIDREFLRQYYHDMVDELEEIFEIFVDETPREVALLTNMFQQNNFKEGGLLLHKIIPSFTNVGLPQLSAQLRQIERQLDPHDQDFVLTELERFQNEFGEYMPDIENELSRLRSLKAA